MDKNKKKTLTISTNLKKKIDTSSISSGNKKSYSVEKKKSFKSGKPFNRPAGQPNLNLNTEGKKNFSAAEYVDDRKSVVDIEFKIQASNDVDKLDLNIMNVLYKKHKQIKRLFDWFITNYYKGIDMIRRFMIPRTAHCKAGCWLWIALTTI